MSDKNKFVVDFEALCKGEDAATIGAKVLRQAKSAMETQVALLNAEKLKVEDELITAKENEAKARLNNGAIISSPESYCQSLVDNAEFVKAKEAAVQRVANSLAFFTEKLKGLEA